MPSILKINEISKRFPGVQALQNVTFEVQTGSIHAVIGENGAGKSTLMQVIAGVHQPDAGTIEFDGEPVKFADPAEAQAKGIAIVYQELNLAPNLSIAENIFLGLEPRRSRVFLDRQKLRTATLTILKQLGLHHDPDSIVQTLTVAQQQAHPRFVKVSFEIPVCSFWTNRPPVFPRPSLPFFSESSPISRHTGSASFTFRIGFLKFFHSVIPLRSCGMVGMFAQFRQLPPARRKRCDSWSDENSWPSNGIRSSQKAMSFCASIISPERANTTT